MSTATRAGLVALLKQWGLDPGSSLHQWRCEHPDRFGPCRCVDELAADIERFFATKLPD